MKPLTSKQAMERALARIDAYFKTPEGKAHIERARRGYGSVGMDTTSNWFGGESAREHSTHWGRP